MSHTATARARCPPEFLIRRSPSATRSSLCLVVSQKEPSTDGRRKERERERERAIPKRGAEGNVGGDANSAFNKVSRGCHLNIVAYSLFSSRPARARAEEAKSRRKKRGAEKGEGRKIGGNRAGKVAKRKGLRNGGGKFLTGRKFRGGEREEKRRDHRRDGLSVSTRAHVRARARVYKYG